MKKLKIAAMGVEHRHIFGQITGMLDVGCEFVGWWTENDNRISNDLEKKLNYLYIITPKGIAEKTRATVHFMKLKMKEYDELRKENEKKS